MTADTTPETATAICAEISRVIRALRGAAARVERMLAKVLDAHGLTPAQFMALQVLHEVEGTPIGCGELGQRLTGVAPDVTRLLDRLDSGGLVSRDRDKNDRRVVHTRITPKGRSVLLSALPQVRDAEERALSELSALEREQVASMLTRIQQHCPAG